MAFKHHTSKYITFYSCFWHYSSLHILCFPIFGQFGLFWALYGHFWVPRVPVHFPHSYLTLKYIKLEHFTPILGLRFSPESHFTPFWPIWTIFGFIWPFLGTQGSRNFFPQVLNIEIHLYVSFYTCFGCYNSLHNLILLHTSQFGPFWAVFGHFWVPRVYQNFSHSYLTLKYIQI